MFYKTKNVKINNRNKEMYIERIEALIITEYLRNLLYYLGNVYKNN